MASAAPMTRSSKSLLVIPNLNFGGVQRIFHQRSVALAEHYEVREAEFSLLDGTRCPRGSTSNIATCSASNFAYRAAKTSAPVTATITSTDRSSLTADNLQQQSLPLRRCL
jgi:hypothetical protein